MNSRIFLATSICLVLFGAMDLCAEGEAVMKITCPDFKNNGNMPVRFTCKGEGVNPALDIENIPPAAKSLVLIVYDPDAPSGEFVHWVVYNIPVTSHIEENSIPGKEGRNHGGGTGYVSPCPPSGTHRYFYKIYALDAMLDLKGAVDKKILEKAMEGHILDKAELVGLVKLR